MTSLGSGRILLNNYSLLIWAATSAFSEENKQVMEQEENLAWLRD